MSFRRAYRRLRFGVPIIVVSGLPRSGTSMAMRMLEAGGMPLVMDGVRAPDEDNPRGYFEDERVKDLARVPDKSWIAGAQGKAIKIISSLLEQLPENHNYLVLFMNRDLHEVLASQGRMLERRKETSDVTDARMLENFERHLVRVKAMLRTRPCFELCEVEYRQVVESPRQAAEKIRAFLGGRLDLGAMVGAVDPSLYRNRR
jgi:hypothetical protein